MLALMAAMSGELSGEMGGKMSSAQHNPETRAGHPSLPAGDDITGEKIMALRPIEMRLASARMPWLQNQATERRRHFMTAADR